ncbi:hypothetical protein QJQ45_007912 [Haematococcus lacustris]|nr:hypothetical protein QJQ45_007912 [Haematococcus lacustris]
MELMSRTAAYCSSLTRGFGLETTAEAQQCQQHQGRGSPLSNWLQEIGILVACAYFKNKEGAYKEQTVYVMTDGKEQSAAITQAAVNQVVHYLLAEHDMDMMQLYMWSDGCAGQFKGAPAMRQHWGMAQRFNVPVWWSVIQLCTLGKKLSVKMLNEYCKAVGLYVPAGTLRADIRYMVLEHLNEQAECGTNVAGPGSCLVYNGSGHLALQPHGSGSMIVQSDEADSDSEDEEEVGSRQAAADMETTFGENEEEEEEGSELGSEPVQLYAIPPKGRRAALVPACEFQQHVDSAKQELAAIADAVVRDLHNRFLPPEHAKGLAVVYAHYWDKQPSDEDFLERLAILNTVLSSAAANPAKEPTTLWRYLAGQPITKAHILEYIKLAELALVMTPGSVEEERMFSAMAYLKDDTRNRLIWTHYQMSVPLASGWITLLCVGATRL